MHKILALSAFAVFCFSCAKKDISEKIASDVKVSKTISSESEDEAGVSVSDTVSDEVQSDVKSTSNFQKWTINRFAKPEISIVVDPKKDTIVTLPEGTKLKITADSFVFAKSQIPVCGKVTLKVREFYKLSDILSAGLSTTSGDRMLETSGMLFIEAESDGRKLDLGNGKEMEIAFASTVKSDMQLFVGKDKKEVIDWELPDTPEFVASGEARFTNFSMNGLKFDVEYDFKGEKRGVYEIRMKPDGTILEAKTQVSITPFVDSQITKQCIGQKVTVSGSRPKGEITNVMPVIVNADDVSVSRMDGVNYQQNARQNAIATRQQALAQKQVSKVSQFFKTPQLGWINCDRFLNFEGERSNLAFDIGENESTTVFLVFRNRKSVLTKSTTSKIIGFSNLPKGEAITAIAIKSDKTGLYLSRENIEISSERMAFNFRKSDTESAQKEIAGWANQRW